jgi:hypothetical protein
MRLHLSTSDGVPIYLQIVALTRGPTTRKTEK